MVNMENDIISRNKITVIIAIAIIIILFIMGAIVNYEQEKRQNEIEKAEQNSHWIDEANDELDRMSWEGYQKALEETSQEADK